MPYYNRDPKRDHNFDNHPYQGLGQGGYGFMAEGLGLMAEGLGFMSEGLGFRVYGLGLRMRA